MTKHLIIKGPIANARRAAARRGIPVRNCKMVGSYREVVCDVPSNAKADRRIMNWFHERDTMRSGRGYAPGALIHFSGAARRRRRRR